MLIHKTIKKWLVKAAKKTLLAIKELERLYFTLDSICGHWTPFCKVFLGAQASQQMSKKLLKGQQALV